MKIHKCPGCGSYTLKGACQKCGRETNPVGPARFSPEDRYGKYRRMMKEEMRSG